MRKAGGGEGTVLPPPSKAQRSVSLKRWAKIIRPPPKNVPFVPLRGGIENPQGKMIPYGLVFASWSNFLALFSGSVCMTFGSPKDH